ncbi:MAG: DUF4248 domain-containing protein [Bacteroidaceae bacterium]|nr:DUF4248 domain-containing protein [Bacteroidaceae bacterium]
MSKTDLALMYFPTSTPATARRHLMSWIAKCQPLVDALRREHYNHKSHMFTKRQMQLIIDYLDDP